MLEQLSVDKAASPLVERAVDGDNVTLQLRSYRAFSSPYYVRTCETNSFKSSTRRTLTSCAASEEHISMSYCNYDITLTLGEGGVVVVQKFLTVEGLEALKDTVTNTTSTDSTDDLALKIVRVARNLRDLPVATLDHLPIKTQKLIRTSLSSHRAHETTYLVSGAEVPDEQEDAHDNVLSNGDNIRARDLEDLETVLDGGVEVDVVRADTCGDAKLKVLCLLHQVRSEVAGMERGCDENFGLGNKCSLRAVRT